MGMVFQHFNLFPHLTVKENLELAPKMLKKKSAAKFNSEAVELLEKIGLTEPSNCLPGQSLRRTKTASSHCPGADVEP